MKKFGKVIKKEADKLGRKADQSIENNTGISVSHITNPDASDHKAAVENARHQVGLDKDNETQLAGAETEATQES